MPISVGGISLASDAVGANDYQNVATPTTWKTVAASQTNFVLGAAGAAGDILDVIVIWPTTVTPGAVTVYDNATPVYTWTLSGTMPWNTPIAIPGPGKSTTGAWKVTTGTNVSVTCRGIFTET